MAGQGISGKGEDDRLSPIIVESIEIENFRGIERGKLEDFKRVNLFVGANGSGKSTILEAIMACVARGGLKDVLGRPLQTLIGRRHGVEKEIDIPSRLQGIALACEPFLYRGASEKVYYPTVKITSGKRVLYALFYRDNSLSPPVSVKHPWKIRDDFDSFFYVDEFLKGDTKEVFPKMKDAIYGPRLDKKIAGLLAEIYPDMEGRKIEGFNPDYPPYLLFEDQGIPVGDLADGLKIALFVIAGTALMENGLLLYEEPENFQNPSALENLTDQVVKTLKRLSGIQSFFTTHSQEFLRYLLDALKKEGLEDDFALYHLVLHRGELKYIRFDYGETVDFLSMGEDLRTLFEILDTEKWAEQS